MSLPVLLWDIFQTSTDFDSSLTLNFLYVIAVCLVLLILHKCCASSANKNTLASTSEVRVENKDHVCHSKFVSETVHGRTEKQLRLRNLRRSAASFDSYCEDLRLLVSCFPFICSASVFSYLESVLFVRRIQPHQHLFTVGDVDGHLFVVKSGELQVYISRDTTINHSNDNLQKNGLVIKNVKRGESVSSLLSFSQSVMGECNAYKSVACKAVGAGYAEVVCVDFNSFIRVFKNNKFLFDNFVQLMVERLDRVVFTALNQHLGISHDLLKHFHHDAKNKVSHDKFDIRTISYNEMLESSIDLFQKEFQSLIIDSVETLKILREKVQLTTFEPGGTNILSQNSKKGHRLFWVICGTVQINQTFDVLNSFSSSWLYSTFHGEFFGQVPFLTGHGSFATYSCDKSEKCVIASISRPVFSNLIKLNSATMCSNSKKEEDQSLHVMSWRSKLLQQTIQRLSLLVREIDFAIDWLSLSSGEVLFNRNSETDAAYIVLSGQFTSITTNLKSKKKHQNSNINTHEEKFVPGNVVGLLECIIGQERRSCGVRVERNADVCRIPLSLLKLLKRTNKSVFDKLMHMIGRQLLMETPVSSSTQSPHSFLNILQQSTQSQSSQTISNDNGNIIVAIYPSSESIDMHLFTKTLCRCISRYDSVKKVNQSLVTSKFGSSSQILRSSNVYRLNSWISQLESVSRVILLECAYTDDDYDVLSWNSFCLRRADLIFDVISVPKFTSHLNHTAVKPYRVTHFEDYLLLDDDATSKIDIISHLKATSKNRKNIELILLHDSSTMLPRNTKDWLRVRPWVSNHYHVKYEVNDHMKHEDDHTVNIHSDFCRLARRILTISVGVVFGGGGAKGAAHGGMIQAMLEADIPIDKVGGVSIGAFAGGLWSIHRNLQILTEKNRLLYDNVTTRWTAVLKDFTYPHISLMKGGFLNDSLKEIFRLHDTEMNDTTSINIEDFWLPFFCCSSDITNSCLRIHTSGPFWTYCRASMSYASFVPPICDPLDGHLLLDGCYVNNVPGHVMSNIYDDCKHILAIDIAGQEDDNLTNYGDHLSGWRVFFSQNFVDPLIYIGLLPPHFSLINVPSQSNLQLRLAFCAHFAILQELKSDARFEYIKVPLDQFSSSDLAKIDVMRDIGYQHGHALFSGLRRRNQKRLQ